MVPSLGLASVAGIIAVGREAAAGRRGGFHRNGGNVRRMVAMETAAAVDEKRRPGWKFFGKFLQAGPRADRYKWAVFFISSK